MPSAPMGSPCHRVRQRPVLTPCIAAQCLCVHVYGLSRLIRVNEETEVSVEPFKMSREASCPSLPLLWLVDEQDGGESGMETRPNSPAHVTKR